MVHVFELEFGSVYSFMTRRQLFLQMDNLLLEQREVSVESIVFFIHSSIKIISERSEWQLDLSSIAVDRYGFQKFINVP